MTLMNAKETMTHYFETWNERDFDAFQAQLADEITFAGPMGTASGPAECRRGIEGLSNIVSRAEVLTMVGEGDEVIDLVRASAGRRGAGPGRELGMRPGREGHAGARDVRSAAATRLRRPLREVSPEPARVRSSRA